ncbi:MAG: SH3 domain-containing protein [Clostridiales bacterium]|nr:SH3 domain-containing protein [Clostridiales bacterium]
MEHKEKGLRFFAALGALTIGIAATAALWATGLQAADRTEADGPQTAALSQEALEDYVEEYDASSPEDDPLYVRMMDNGVLEEAAIDTTAVAANLTASSSGSTTLSPYTGSTYTHASRFSDSLVLMGIDVSHWQSEIDWEAVAADGVTFVFIRCGYTGTADDFHMVEDTRFAENIQGAYDAGIAVGIYYFSQALTVEEAEQEAAMTLSLLEPYQDMITLPVVYDLEKVSDSRTKGLSAAKATANALAWLEAVEAQGYTAYYYGSTGVLGDLFDLTQLEDYGCWVARYNTSTSSSLDYDFWQYTDVGEVDGIDTAVDCDFYYMDDIGSMGTVTVTAGDSGCLTLRWSAVEGATHYQIYRSTSSGSGFSKVKTVSASNLSYEDTGLEDGTTYYYKVRAYSNSGYIPIYSGFSSVVSAAVGGSASSGSDSNGLLSGSNSISGEAAVTTAALNLRSGAGTDYSVVTVIPKGETVTVLDKTDDTWYQVSYTNSAGTIWTGYVSAAYLTVSDSGSDNSSNSVSGEAAVTTAALNLRSGAGTDYSVVTVIPKGDTVTVLDKTNESWYQVSYTCDGTTWTGYVSAAYLTAGDNSSSSGSNSSSSSSNSISGETAVTTAALNLRSGPGTSCSVVTVLPSGAEVTVLDKTSDTWYQVSYTASGSTWTGYVSASYLTTDSDAADASSTATTACSLNLRSGPGTDYDVVTVLPGGAEVTVLDTSNGTWYQVSYTASGTTWTGYVSAAYLQ